jgi:hypothetical protein
MHVMLLTRVTGFVYGKNCSLARSWRKPKAIGHRASDVNKPINFQQHLNSFETVEVRAHRGMQSKKKAGNTFVGWELSLRSAERRNTIRCIFMQVYLPVVYSERRDWLKSIPAHANNIGHCGRKHTHCIYTRRSLGAACVCMCGDGDGMVVMVEPDLLSLSLARSHIYA